MRSWLDELESGVVTPMEVRVWGGRIGKKRKRYP